MNRRELRDLLSKYENIYILTHTLPDGDAIGSALAWGAALKHYGKKVRVFCPGVIPRKYHFLPGASAIEHIFPPAPPSGIIFILDCGDLERLDYMSDRVHKSGIIVNIDHHATNLHFGDFNIVDTSAAATGEIIYRLMLELEFPLNHGISMCLYAAIASDTGSFKYGNTTSHTLQVAAALLENGVDPALVSQKIFDEYPRSTVYLLRDALATLQLDETFPIAWMNLHEDVLDDYDARAEELEGFVNYAKNINGIEVGIFFYHTCNGDTKVGFRSKTVDVSAVAGIFGGGGHPRAAGCTINGHAGSDAIKMVIRAVKDTFSEKEPLATVKCENK